MTRLPISLAEVRRSIKSQNEKINKLTERNTNLRELLANVVMNSQLVPDPTMEGSTDIYIVPVDDIHAAADLLGCRKYIELRDKPA